MKRFLCLRIQKKLPDASPLLSIAEWCRQFTPLVGIEAVPAPQCVLLEIAAVAHLFGGEASLAEQIIEALVARGWPITAALADTLGAAWALATYHAGGTRHCSAGVPPASLQPRAAALPQTAAGTAALRQTAGETPALQPLVIVPSQQTASALRPLPIEALRLPQRVVELLQSLGVWQIAQLDRLPRRELLARFGNELLACWDRALGRMAEPLPAVHPQPQFTAAWSAEYPLADRAAVSLAFEHLAGELARQLREHGQGAMRLECRLQCSDAAPVEIAVGLFQPTAWAAHFVQLLQVQFDNRQLPGPVETVRLSAPFTAPLEFRQQELFAAGTPRRHPRQLASLIERLSNRLGHTRVMRVGLRPEAQPELACRYQPWVEGGQRSGGGRGRNLRKLHSDIEAESGNVLGTLRVPSAANGTRSVPNTMPRPLRLLTHAVPLDVDSQAGLVQFSLGGAMQRVAYRWGPERIETGWWRGRTAVRDYYCIETLSGRRYWVFRRLTDRKWFLHGVFD
jgi:protein ImuB